MSYARYSRAIAYLKKHPNEIREAWRTFPTHPAGCLFQFAGNGKVHLDGRFSGCLTQIRLEPETFRASTLAMTRAIIADTRIPITRDKITLADLPVFAEWQRILNPITKKER